MQTHLVILLLFCRKLECKLTDRPCDCILHEHAPVRLQQDQMFRAKGQHQILPPRSNGGKKRSVSNRGRVDTEEITDTCWLNTDNWCGL